MTKQVIVVVHGVGVKQAGVSSDLLAAALQSPPADMKDAADAEKARLPPHSSDDYLLLEDRKYDDGAKANTFPARIRRYRSYHDDGKLKHERVIAELFWGDITAFGLGIVDMVLAYFKVAMGLSHAIRENARSVFPAKSQMARIFLRTSISRRSHAAQP